MTSVFLKLMVAEEKGCKDASGAIARLQDKGRNHAFA